MGVASVGVVDGLEGVVVALPQIVVTPPATVELVERGSAVPVPVVEIFRELMVGEPMAIVMDEPTRRVGEGRGRLLLEGWDRLVLEETGMWVLAASEVMMSVLKGRLTQLLSAIDNDLLPARTSRKN